MTNSTGAVRSAVPRYGWMGNFRLAMIRDYAIIISFVALFATLSLTSSVFLTKTNLLNILDQSSALGIVAAGGTVVFIAGGFDLSVGAVFAMSGVVAAEMEPRLGPAGAMGLALLVGLALGISNGVIVTVGRINSFMATIGTGFVIRGFAIVITGGLLITVFNPSYQTLGRSQLFGARYSVWTWALFVLLLTLMLRYTVFGRAVFASGGNPEAARLSGIRVNLVKTIAFGISGFSAALGGLIVSSRVQTGQADAGTGIELTVIAAIVIGGTSIFGGEGAIWRSALGILLLTLIGNGFDLLHVNPIYQQIMQGSIILFACGLDAWARKTR
jgi:ribose transport system permease protein